MVARKPKGKLEQVVDELVAGMDKALHQRAVQRLLRCRTRADLDALAGAWLSRAPDPEIRLVCHAGSTYLVVRYEDGWTSRLAMVPWPR